MIRVDFIYKTKNENIDLLNEKFIFSGSDKFKSEVTNTGIEKKSMVIGSYTFVLLTIYYNNEDEYQQRSEFEQSKQEWVECWKEPNDVFELISKEICTVE